MECLKNLVKIKGACEVDQVGPFVQDWVNLPSSILAHIASVDELSGAIVGESILDSAINQVQSDISSGFANGNSIKSGNVFSLVHDSTYTNSYIPNAGSYISNFYRSAFSKITINSITFKAQFDGPFVLILEDGLENKEFDMVAQSNVQLVVPIEYSTKSKYVKIYAKDTTKNFALMTKNNACGSCTDRKFYMEFKGLQNGVITTTPIGFVPYAFIECDSDFIQCNAISNAMVKPLVGKAIAIKTGIIAYTRLLLSPRLNDSTVNINQEAVGQYLSDLENKYRETIFGSVQAYGHAQTKGVVDLISATLKGLSNDACIDCSARIYTSAVAF
jgi:hypothetical protein